MQRAKRRRAIKHDKNGKQICSTFNTTVKFKHSVMVENKRIANHNTTSKCTTTSNCNTTSNCKKYSYFVKTLPLNI